MSQMIEQDKTSEKELNEMETINLPDKAFKLRVIKMLSELRRRMEGHSENFYKETENIKKNQSELNKITKMRNTLEETKCRLDDTEEQISNLEDRLMKIIQMEKQKEKRNKKNKDSLRDLCDNIKCTNIHIIGVPEGEERGTGTENLFEEIMAENFPNLAKETYIQVQESQKVPNKMNPKRPTPRHSIIKVKS